MSAAIDAAILKIENQGWLHKTDPRVKIVFLACYTLLNLMFLEPLALFLLTAALLFHLRDHHLSGHGACRANGR